MGGNEGKEGEEGKKGKDKVGEHDRRGKSYLIASLFIQSTPGTGTQVFYQYSHPSSMTIYIWDDQILYGLKTEKYVFNSELFTANYQSRLNKRNLLHL